MASEAPNRGETGDFANMVTLAGIAVAAQAALQKNTGKVIDGLPSMNKTLFKRVASTNAFEATGGPGFLSAETAYEGPGTRTVAGESGSDALMREPSGISFKD